MVVIVVMAALLPDAWLNQPYRSEARWQSVSARCGQPIPLARLAGGRLPAGLRLNAKGEPEGIPTEPGTYRFTVELSDGCSRRTEERELRVQPAPILTAEAETGEFRCPQGAPPFAAGAVRVSGSAPGRPYTVEILDGAWLRATMRSGAIPTESSGFDADRLQLWVEPAKLVPGVYRARLRVSTWEGANAPELLFTLRVDAVQSILTPASSVTPLPVPLTLPVIELPSPQTIVPPAVNRPAPPKLSTARPKAAVRQNGGSPIPPRSRVLPFPNVKLPERATPPEPAKETPPERTKPSAMPPPAAAAKGKPPAAH